MANKKKEIGAQPKAAPATTPLEQDQKPKASASSPGREVPVVTSEPVGEEVEKGRKAQATKKAAKELQMMGKEPAQDRSKVPEMPAAPLEAKVDDEEAKDGKVKEAKVKKQVDEPVAAETAPSKKAAAVPAAEKATNEKATKMKRLTLDIAKPLHKAIKAKAVEEGVPMVDMLRSLLEEHYSK
ncbi:MAG: hypothetical protein KME11_20040 [Timaviella obliquedivisa GSE-PSE-MK23-08B]|jgi:predicted DNA binding CopG/RHH family protein|nr:hypothetical protein [Timaviella obliquedivisa GSE-PSE-MK23-08B]